MQTTALLIDSFRMMVARRLFWITLALNLIIVIAYGSIGSNADGLTIGFGLMTLDMPIFANDSTMYRGLLQLIFSSFLVTLWLGWIATILALISTTSIFPDFQQEGAIDIVLSKPISRVKIFLVKYLGSLIFVFLQVAIFCLGVFLVVGLRLQTWNWTILAGIPIVLAFYSYLYSFNALIGIATRSAIAALLLTMLFWFSLFVIQSAESTLNLLQTEQRMAYESSQRRVEQLERRLERTTNPQSIGEALSTSLNHPDTLRARIEAAQADAEDQRRTMESLQRWHERMRFTLAALPKSQETIGLLDRWIRADTKLDFDDFIDETQRAQRSESSPATVDAPDPDSGAEAASPDRSEVAEKVQEDYDARSPWFIIGTSLGFEAVMLAIACFIFVRRDY